MNSSAPKPKSKKRAREIDMFGLMDALESSVALPKEVPFELKYSDSSSEDSDDDYIESVNIEPEFIRPTIKKRNTQETDKTSHGQTFPTINRRYRNPDRRRIDAPKRIARYYSPKNDVKMDTYGVEY